VETSQDGLRGETKEEEKSRQKVENGSVLKDPRSNSRAKKLTGRAEIFKNSLPARGE
jgi:hypothetical protein